MKRLRHLLLRLCLASTFVVIAPCTNVYDLCPPLDDRRPFFARGDCTVTREGIFAGHEWLTLFAIEALPERALLSQDDVDTIIDGNRRVDWPRELLIHLNVGLHAYVAAILDYTEDPERQADHFLLANRDSYEEAADAAHRRLRFLTRESVDGWATSRPHALTQLGAALHLIQDSYSEAHAVRDTDRRCVEKIKAYIERDEGFLTDDIEFHGNRLDEPGGHSSPQDSIFDGSDECRNPSGAEEVEACLRDSARLAVTASRDYVEMVLALADAGPWTSAADDAVDRYISAHLALCPD